MLSNYSSKWSGTGLNTASVGPITSDAPRGLSAAATMSSQFLNRRKVRQYRTLSMVCDEEPLSDVQMKILHQRNQEYQNFMELMSRLASAVNVCLSEESVIIGDNGLLTAESLNALQHSGAISVYNTLQINDWKYPLPEEGEMVVSRPNWSAAEDPADLDKILKTETPALHLTECLVDGDQTELLGGVRPLRGLLPPTLIFRSVAEVEDETAFDTQDVSQPMGEPLEIVSTNRGLAVKKAVRESRTSQKETTLIVPLDEYYYHRMEGSNNYREEKGEYRFRCHVCSKMLYSNVKLMFHMMSHIDESLQPLLNPTGLHQCTTCFLVFPTPFAVRQHMEESHPGNNTCRICEKDMGNENGLRRHMQATHRHREMPYICQLCFFRTSLFEDVLDHFKKTHYGSSYLLCVYCLRVFRISFSSAQTESGFGATGVFYQHLQKHQQKQLCRRCQACRLQFVNKSDCHIHRQLDHKSGPSRDEESTTKPLDGSSTVVFAESGESEAAAAGESAAGESSGEAVIKRLNVPAAARDLTTLTFPEEAGNCVECREQLGADGHRQYIPCMECRFATCCSAAYTQHQTSAHGVRARPGPLSRRAGEGPALEAAMYCPACGFTSTDGNQLAEHLVTQCCVDTAVSVRPELPEVRTHETSAAGDAPDEPVAATKANAEVEVSVQQQDEPAAAGDEGGQEAAAAEAAAEDAGTTTVLVESTDEHGTGTVTTVTLGSRYTVLVESGEEGEVGVAQPTAMRLLQADDGGLMLVSEDGQLVVPVGPAELEMIKQQDEAAEAEAAAAAAAAAQAGAEAAASTSGAAAAAASDAEASAGAAEHSAGADQAEPMDTQEAQPAAPQEEEMLVVEMDQDSGAPGMLLYENLNTAEAEKENIEQS